MKIIFFVMLFGMLVACDTAAPTSEQAPETTTAPAADEAPATAVATAMTTADITPEQVRELFEQGVLQRLLAQEEGRKLHENSPHLDKGMRVLVADIDGDQQPEGIVQYQLLSGMAEAAAMPVVEGIYIYPSKDGQLQPVKMTRVDLPAAGTYLQQIEGKVWRFKALEYAKDDARCCPSITTEKSYQLSDLYAWEPVN